MTCEFFHKEKQRDCLLLYFNYLNMSSILAHVGVFFYKLVKYFQFIPDYQLYYPSKPALYN